MKHIWLVANKEFIHRVRSRGYILATLIVPVSIFILIAVSGRFDFSFEPTEEQVIEPPTGIYSLIGYVDLAGYIQFIPADLPGDLFQDFPDINAANQALQAKEIEVYYLIPEGYLEHRQIKRVSVNLPFGGASDIQLFNIVLSSNLFPESSPEELALIRYPFGASRPQFVEITAQDLVPRPEPEFGVEPPDQEEQIGFGVSMMPMLVTMIIIIPLFTSGGYLLQSLSQEKSNRVMELLLLSLRPSQLLAGKLIGFGALTLLQYVIWVVFAGAALTLMGQSIPEMLSEINLSVLEVLYLILFALGGYALYSAFMAGVGALAPNLEGGRTLVLIAALPMFIPFYFWVFIVNDPNGVLAVVLSLIPFSAPVAMLMRLTAATVPGWQIGLSLALLALTSYGIIRLMARLFQVQTLLSGEAISLKRIWFVLKNP
ncbi:MAG: ABC transporter permease [Anaerolineales bacterium]|nr:ABC transporter permease [Anaerolineales bacterium]